MKIKTSELTGPALDWAVAKCEWVEWTFETATTAELIADCHYSTNWSQGGPIIEREKISLVLLPSPNYTPNKEWNYWMASVVVCGVTGPTALVAAMRCLVASRLGDEVDVPEELA